MTPPRAPALASRWRTTPSGLARLLLGLWIFGTGDALIVLAGLGNAPWTVLAEGVSLISPLSIGAATQVIGVVVLCGWLPLRERPGLGTIANVVVIGFSIDVMLALLPAPSGLVGRSACVVAGVALVGLGSGLYLSADLGAGPRDGWMTGITRRTGWPVSAVRFGIEATVLAGGWALGGTVGLGTLAFALLVGPSVGVCLRLVGLRRRDGAPRA